MSAAETWFTIAAVLAGLAAVVHLLELRPPRRTAPPEGTRVTVVPNVGALGRVLAAAAIALLAVGLVVGFP